MYNGQNSMTSATRTTVTIDFRQTTVRNSKKGYEKMSETKYCSYLAADE
jgi:ribosomal protein L33